MADSDTNSEVQRERKRDIAARLLKTGIAEGTDKLKEGELLVKHSLLGVGQTPNVVPVFPPATNANPREIHVGWHPVGGAVGKWFADDTRIGKLITNKINKYPDPTQHWAVLVGEYAHQLWMDENFDVIYTNAKIVREEWTTFHVGHTRFNDDAVRRTGEMVISHVREKQAAYNLITNNCQTYALLLLDAIKADGVSKFPTTLNVYKALTGPGKVMDLFKPESEGGAEPDPEAPEAVSVAAALMDQHTTQLDTHESGQHHHGISHSPHCGHCTGDLASDGLGAEKRAGNASEAAEALVADGPDQDGEADKEVKKKGLLARLLRK